MRIIYLYFMYFLLFFCCQKNNNLVIREFHNGQKVNEYRFTNDTISKIISFNIQTKKVESEIIYFNGIPDFKNSPEIERDFLDYNFFLEVLKEQGIEPKNSIILGSDLNDLSNILSIMDNYNDYEKIVSKTQENTTIIKLVGLNKNIRFTPSLLTMFIPDNTLIKDYELSIKDSQPIKECYTLKGISFVKEYIYDSENLIKIVYKTIDENKKEKVVFEKKFEYSW